jgi:hypothetical protein
MSDEDLGGLMPWDPQPNEPETSFAGFCLYRDLWGMNIRSSAIRGASERDALMRLPGGARLSQDRPDEYCRPTSPLERAISAADGVR